MGTLCFLPHHERQLLIFACATEGALDRLRASVSERLAFCERKGQLKLSGSGRRADANGPFKPKTGLNGPPAGHE
jgi:hypothetical protein